MLQYILLPEDLSEDPRGLGDDRGIGDDVDDALSFMIQSCLQCPSH